MLILINFDTNYIFTYCSQLEKSRRDLIISLEQTTIGKCISSNVNDLLYTVGVLVIFCSWSVKCIHLFEVSKYMHHTLVLCHSVCFAFVSYV